MLITLDSSVIVAALRDQEPFHDEALRVLEQIRNGGHVAIQPLTTLVEVGAAIRRRTGSQDLALRVGRDLRALRFVRFVELDAGRAAAALEIASESGVRGMDAIVAQIAREFGTALVSLDLELAGRVSSLVRVVPIADVI